jgi:cytochrome c oxidase subunit 2
MLKVLHRIEMCRRLILLLATSLLWAGCSSAPPSGVRAINIVAKKYAFEPEIVRVRLGETVLFRVSTPDVQHGFEVSELGIRESIQPNMPADIVFHATRRGRFRIDCHIKCGKGHDDMTGEIVVE